MKYPLGLESYPRPRPRAQTQTRIRAQRVGYLRVRGYFVSVAIFTQHLVIGILTDGQTSQQIQLGKVQIPIKHHL